LGRILNYLGRTVAYSGDTPTAIILLSKTLNNAHDYNNQVSSLRAPVERAVADLKTWRILFTDYRRPLKTFLSSFHTAIGL
jgi:hypothetical protein